MKADENIVKGVPMSAQGNRGYELTIDYDQNDSSYSVFKNVASLMFAIDELNNAIAKSFSEEIETEAVILSIGSGSVKIWLRDKLKNLPEEKIKAYVKNPKEAIADLLIAVKRRAIKALDHPKEIENRIPQIVKEEIEKSQMRAVGYTIHKTKLLEAVSDLSKSAGAFNHPPILYIQGERMTIIDSYTFDPKTMEGVTTTQQTLRGQFIIKKPDLVGESRWTIIFDRNIDVTITDKEWLDRLHRREFAITPGDRLDADLKIETYIDQEDMSVIETRYYIPKIYGIVPPRDEAKQTQLIEEN